MVQALRHEDNIQVAAVEAIVIGVGGHAESVPRMLKAFRSMAFPDAKKAVEIMAERVKAEFADMEHGELRVTPTDDGAPRRSSFLGGSRVFRSVRGRG